MIVEYKINFKNHLRVLRSVVIYHVVFIAGYIYSMLQVDNGHGVFTMVFEIGYAVSMIPVLFLHIEYYVRNKNDIFQINHDQNNLKINGKQIGFKEIEKIILYMPDAWRRGSSLRIFPFENYRYAKIQMIDGNKYIFTCLMAFKLEDVIAQIKGVPVGISVRLVATPLIN